MAVINNLKYWRHMLQMNQTEFAEYLGVSRGQCNRYENQAVQPTLEVAIKIYKKLKTRFTDITFLDIFDTVD